jgi:hypothetical protein
MIIPHEIQFLKGLVREFYFKSAKTRFGIDFS